MATFAKLISLLLAVGLACATDQRAGGYIESSDAGGVGDGEPRVVYQGGDGSSCDQAVVIVGHRDIAEAAAAEKAWITKHYPGYVRVGGSVEHPVADRNSKTDSRLWAVAHLRSPEGTSIEVCFEIGSFRRKE